MSDTTALESGDVEAIANSLLVNEEQDTTETETDETSQADADGQVDDEDAGEDADDVASDEDDQDDDEYDDNDDAEDAEQKPDEVYTVKVDGREQKVTLDELRRGYSGQKYIQQQMEDVANGRKEVESAFTQLQHEMQSVAALRQKLETGNVPQRPTPPSPAMFEQDPIGYMEAKIKFDEAEQQWQESTRDLEIVAQKQQALTQQAFAATRATEFEKLRTVLPDFADPDKGAALREKVVKAGTSYGYTPEDIGQIVDSRAIHVLHDAMRYRQMMEARGAAEGKAAKPRPMVKAGSKPASGGGKAKKQQQAMQRMRSTGDVDDVAKFLLS